MHRWWPALCLAATACATRTPEPGERANVYLFTVDTLRADHTSPYGYERDTTPWLQTLADRGQAFSHCVSTSSWTVPSMAALHTGEPPWTMGLHRAPSLRVDGTGRAEHPVLPASATTLAERFSAAGYRTAALTANAHLANDLGWAQGFSTYTNVGWGTVDQLDDALGTLVGEGPSFVWIHVFDPHDPYFAVPGSPWVPDPRFGRLDVPLSNLKEGGLASTKGLIDLYDGEILDTDRWLAHAAERLGVSDEDVVLFASDHGEEFGERGHLGHRKTLHEESVHVPCVLVAPGRSGRVERPVGLAEVGRHLLAASGLEPEPDAEPVITHLWHPGTEVWAAYGPAGKQLVAGEEAVRFDLASDPTEQVPLPPDPALVAAIAAARGTIETTPTKPKGVEGLQALGYVDGP